MLILNRVPCHGLHRMCVSRAHRRLIFPTTPARLSHIQNADMLWLPLTVELALVNPPAILPDEMVRHRCICQNRCDFRLPIDAQSVLGQYNDAVLLTCSVCAHALEGVQESAQADRRARSRTQSRCLPLPTRCEPPRGGLRG